MTKSRSIIFNAEMVRAILKGTKTQTRRVVKSGHDILDFPYGNLGDLLWVRETIKKKVIGLEWGLYGATYAADFTAVMGEGPRGSYCGRAVVDWKWKRDTLPSIHMPRWASRITLEITEVRAERIQQISYEDIRAEGVESNLNLETTEARNDFLDLWDSINAKRGYSWESNPWVWVITFERVDTQEG